MALCVWPSQLIILNQQVPKQQPVLISFLGHNFSVSVLVVLPQKPSYQPRLALLLSFSKKVIPLPYISTMNGLRTVSEMLKSGKKSRFVFRFWLECSTVVFWSNSLLPKHNLSPLLSSFTSVCWLLNSHRSYS